MQTSKKSMSRSTANAEEAEELRRISQQSRTYSGTVKRNSKGGDKMMNINGTDDRGGTD